MVRIAPHARVGKRAIVMVVGAALVAASCGADERDHRSTDYPITAWEALKGLQHEYRGLQGYKRFTSENCRFSPVDDTERPSAHEAVADIPGNRTAPDWEVSCGVDGEEATFGVGASKLVGPVPEMRVWPISRAAFRKDANNEIFNFVVDCWELADYYEDAPEVSGLCSDILFTLTDEYVPSRRPVSRWEERCHELNSLSEEEWQALDGSTKRLYGLGCGPP